jgi:hypothetical protein
VKDEDPEEVILAKVGDVTISLNEFIRRAEMTIRPGYCSGDNNVHKKIILNSLIAEKMLTAEAGDNNDLDQSKPFQLYIQGRQEQAMREWLRSKEGYEKVQLKDSEIQKEYKYSGRTYKVQYFDIPDDTIAVIVKEKLIKNEDSFISIHQQLWHDEDLADKEIAWKSQELPMIHEALFTDNIVKGSVIGPLKIENNNHIVMKVIGWTDQKIISENDRKEKWNEVKEKMTQERAFKLFDNYAFSIMEGKKLDFDRDTFNKLIKVIGPMYIRTPQDKQDLFMNAVFDGENNNPELKQLADGINGLLDNSLLSIDDQVWTVREFQEEIQKHPLVFRKNIPQDTKFAEQFRLAIVDMIRDKYLTQEAYKRGYENVNVVKRHTQMWHDALLAQYQKDQYLRNTVTNLPDSINTLVVIQDYLNPYIDQLQKKYSDRIEVDVEQFNNIKLTRIDMIAYQTNVPFPIMVPSFPQITTDSKLDYGQKME